MDQWSPRKKTKTSNTGWRILKARFVPGRKTVRWPVVAIVAIFAAIGSFFIYQSFAANANLPGDINSDNKVDLTDLSMLLGKWNTSTTTHDINNDGTINLQDLSILLSNWNKTYTPTTPTPPTPTPPTPTPPTPSTFPEPTTFAGPLKASSDGHYLVDQNNKPFLMMADTAWSLMVFLNPTKAKEYIDLRKAQGYNTILTNITFNQRFASGPQGTAFTNGNLDQPHEDYFKAVDEVVKYAESKNVVLEIGTLWTGSNGGKWGGTLPPVSQFQAYGTWLGNRYKEYKNIVWFVGGDDTPYRNMDNIRANAVALKAADPNHLITYHTDSKAYNVSGESWLGYNSIQWNSNSSPLTYADAREGYGKGKPYINMEPAYDPKACCGDTDTTEIKNRHNGWWEILGGSLGVTYGGPESTWRVGAGTNAIDYNGINRNGARHTAFIRKIMEPLKWQTLVPDWDNATVTSGRGSYGSTNYATAGRASDGSLIVAYAPQATTFSVNLTKLSGAATAQWYDPANGNAVGSAVSVSNTGSQNFATPGNNSGGGQDWVLVIKR
jgi:hypothetical protein